MGITLDFAGGLLSLMQLFIDAQIINHDWNGVKGDPGKLGLAFISIIFDVILLGEIRSQQQGSNCDSLFFFAVQHYLIFGNAAVEEEGDVGEETDGERQPLLGS